MQSIICMYSKLSDAVREGEKQRVSLSVCVCYDVNELKTVETKINKCFTQWHSTGNSYAQWV